VTAFELIEAAHPAMPVVAAFDVVVNNADRKGGHTLLDTSGRVWGIDHGVCFSDEPGKLRTVIWDYAGDPVPPELLDDLRRLSGQLSGGFGKELRGLLTPDELEALRRRTDRLADKGVFPEPRGSRPYPWPLV
jgi:uncharacterized repeat protein (TIGR03843 family)